MKRLGMFGFIVAALMIVLFATPAVPAEVAHASTTHARTFTFVNHEKVTIWVGGFQQTAKPALSKAATGFALKAGKSISVKVPDTWNGRFWGRTGCHFSSKHIGSCSTGACGKKLHCTGYGSIPATLAEFNLDSWRHLDFYDVSMVDGSNLPMYINISGGSTKDPLTKYGCSKAGCTTAVRCPAALLLKNKTCESPCARIGGDRYCCSGIYASGCNPATTWPIDYATVFKKAEPYAYSWSGDDATSTFTCTRYCNYRITFGVTAAAHSRLP